MGLLSRALKYRKNKKDNKDSKEVADDDLLDLSYEETALDSENIEKHVKDKVIKDELDDFDINESEDSQEESSSEDDDLIIDEMELNEKNESFLEIEDEINLTGDNNNIELDNNNIELDDNNIELDDNNIELDDTIEDIENSLFFEDELTNSNEADFLLDNLEITGEDSLNELGEELKISNENELSEDVIENEKEYNDQDLIEQELDKKQINFSSTTKEGKKFQDFVILYEISREIMEYSSLEEIYDFVLFSIMGQLGASAASIIVPTDDDESRWILAESRGVNLSTKNISFRRKDFILNDILSKNDIVDIEKYRNNPECADEFQKFLSIDSRLNCPLINKDKNVGLVILGDKITIGDYSESEKEFLKSVCEIFALAKEKILEFKKLSVESNLLNEEYESTHDLDIFEDNLRTVDDEKIFYQEFDSKLRDFSVDAYGIFLKNDINQNYELRFTDSNDAFSLKDANIKIEIDNSFIAHLYKISQYEKIENPVNSDILKKVFPQKKLLLFDIFIIFPFVVKNTLVGFGVVFKFDSSKQKNLNILYKTFKSIFSAIFSQKSLTIQDSKFIDDIALINKRLERELKFAKSMNIPISFVLFSIKNFKRFYSVLGEEKSNQLLDIFKDKIKSLFSSTDYAVRYSKSKFLVVLPGKNKKFSVSFANSVRSKTIKEYGSSKVQVMITFLISEYPEDGENLFELIDLID